MTRLVLLGGPLDGRDKLVRSLPAFVWIAADPSDDKQPVRIWKSPGSGRHLYRSYRRRQGPSGHETIYTYAGHTHAFCCGGYHAKPEEGEWRCMVCGNRVTPAHIM